MNSVNWEEQWASFAENFYDGKAHIDLRRFGGSEELLLYPGPGFGDLSHPTTYLMLKMLSSHVKNRSVIDIGTGSGILALASLLFGAKSTFGIDIDPEALTHAEKNNALNDLTASFGRHLPATSHTSVFLMNMIFPEQREIRPEQWNGKAELWITSGILAEQKAAYLKQAAEWGWSVLEEHKRRGWLGFVFRIER